MLREYETQSTLNPKLWDGDRLKEGLTYKFLRIAKHFYDFLEIPEEAQVLDVILIGSNANYNWTETSDIDLHVVIDYQAVGDNLHLVKNYMMAKKSIWNENYPLTYKGMDVELFAQDWNDRLHSSVGQYSLMRGKWLKKPNSEIVSIDDEVIEAKADPIEYEIMKLDAEDPMLETKVKTILQQLYKMRQTGLEAEGEYSVENLAFKRIRNKGLISRLKEMGKQITLGKLQLGEGANNMNALAELAAHIMKHKTLDDDGWKRVMKYTNAVEDSQGQWKHPKRCTMIPSNKITMRNVPYRVLGIDDTGHTKIMEPENDYGYPGGKVLEIPMTPEQNTILKKLRKLLTGIKMVKEQWPAGPYGKEHDYSDYGGPFAGNEKKSDWKKGPGIDPTKPANYNWKNKAVTKY